MFEALQRPGSPYRLHDLGPSLEYHFLFFNLNDLSGRNLDRVAAKQLWFRNAGFRRAISLAIDRAAIARLVYRGHGSPLWWHVTPANRLWENTSLPKPARSVAKARELLQSAGFSWNGAGKLVDRDGRPVEFSVLTSAGNTDREQMATLIQADLKDLGIDIRILTLEFRSLLSRVQSELDFEACLLGLGGSDPDPAPEMSVWLSSGSAHFWDVTHKLPDTPWQAELDRLMTAQLSAPIYAERKQMYDRVQQIVAEQLPIICLASPNVLVGVRNGLQGIRPGIVPPYALSNLDEVFWSEN
jgi:peptide/nickel transport system substrate-binding protein